MTKKTNSVSSENKLGYDGTVSQLYGIYFVNLFLTIITLGIYGFWGKTRTRKYLAGSVQLAGDRFEYIGTGKELFIGFLKAIPIIILLYLPIILFPALTFVAAILIFYLVLVAYYAALQYRFSRTVWRGIRSSLGGSAFKFGWISAVRFILNVITLGLLTPRSDVKVYNYITEHAKFGDQKFTLDADASKLTKTNIITLLLAIPTAFLSRVWYKAALARHIMDRLTVMNNKFKTTVTGGAIVKHYLGNIGIIILLALGVTAVLYIIVPSETIINMMAGDVDFNNPYAAQQLAALKSMMVLFYFYAGVIVSFLVVAPILTQRNMKFFVQHLTILGDADTKNVKQSDVDLKSSGEGLHTILAE